MKKVCAVIVTFNRPELLCRCVERLLQQVYPLDILIYDNHSSQDTKSELEKRNLLKNNVTYFYADENSGGSGGFHNGMKMAMEKNYDALWLMDDDGYAINSESLSAVMNAWSSLDYVDCMLNSLVVCDEETLRLSFSLDRTYDGNEIINRAENNLIAEFVSPFNGTFVTAGIINKLGYPMKEFFVYGDETEYFLRIFTNKYPVYTVVNSLYYHPSVFLSEKKFLGFDISPKKVPLWKTYCSARNTVYFSKKYFGVKGVIKTVVKFNISILFAKENRILKFKTLRRGIKDGLKGDFSKPIDLSR
jgi:GT2 family glycosyltransferase